MAEDSFQLLENVQVGEDLPESVTVNGTLVINKDPGDSRVIYTFSSHSSTHPHIIHVLEGKISFIQLTIPSEAAERYSLLLTSLGEAEVSLPKTPTEMMFSYPSQGIAFIVSDAQNKQVLRIQKYPVKTARAFVEEEGKNFQPVPERPESVSIMPSFTPSPSALPGTGISNQEIGLIIVALVFAMIAFVLMRKKIRPSS